MILINLLAANYYICTVSPPPPGGTLYEIADGSVSYTNIESSHYGAHTNKQVDASGAGDGLVSSVRLVGRVRDNAPLCRFLQPHAVMQVGLGPGGGQGVRERGGCVGNCLYVWG